MKKSAFLMLSGFLLGILLFNACSKDKKNNHDLDPTDPTEEINKGTASASVLFKDTDETLEFEGISIGGIAEGSQGDTVAIQFYGKDMSAGFYFLLIPVKKGKLVMGENGFAASGIFQADTSKTNIGDSYLLGWDNFSEEDGVEDAATFNITSLNKDRIKGTFTATMILNSTVKENGGIISGVIKTIEVTNGKFDVPLVYE